MSAEIRRAQLRRAALRVMSRDGLAAGTTRAIVAEAGMSLATFHYCFRSRTELLRDLIIPAETGLSEAPSDPATHHVGPPGTTLHDLLRQAVLGHLTQLTADPGQALLLFELTHHALRTPELRELAAERYQQQYASAERLLTEAAEATRMTWQRDPAGLARLLVITIDGAKSSWLAEEDTAATEAALLIMVDHLSTLAVPSTRSR